MLQRVTKGQLPPREGTEGGGGGASINQSINHLIKKNTENHQLKSTTLEITCIQ